MPLKDLHSVMLDELRDLLSAEKQLVKALPKLAKASTSPKLQSAFQDHLEVTKNHVSRLEEAFAELDTAARAKHCKGMEGLITEGSEMLEEEEESPALDAALIGAAQRCEHYEIAAYGTIIAMANEMGHTRVAELLAQTLQEEKEANELLSQLAQGEINPTANTDPTMQGGEENAEDETEPAKTGGNRSRAGARR